MRRLTGLVYAVAITAFALLAADGHGTTAVLGVTVAAFLLACSAVAAAHRVVAAPVSYSPHGAVHEERCLHGTFRAQSSPDAAGRPKPRAPGHDG